LIHCITVNITFLLLIFGGDAGNGFPRLANMHRM